MTGATVPLLPVLLLSDKLMAITNLYILVPVKLNIDEMNYSSWEYFFQHLCKGHKLLDLLFGKQSTSEVESSALPAPDEEWLKIDNIVLSWIFTTIAKPLQSRIVDAKPQTAKEAWDLLAHIFQDNKRTCSIALKVELRSLKLGDLSVDAYFQKIESIVSVLKGLGLPLSDEDVVNLAFEGLPPRYDNVCGIIVQREPFSDLKTVRSILTTKEMRLQSRAQDTFVDSTSSSPLVLMAMVPILGVLPPLRKRVHGSSSRGTKTSTEIPNDDMQTLKNLMAKLGFDASVLNSGTSTVQTSNSGTGTVPMVFHYSHPNNS
ncbi:hybrid signal transduction histidine kinase M [Tanacetum coccineum]